MEGRMQCHCHHYSTQRQADKVHTSHYLRMRPSAHVAITHGFHMSSKLEFPTHIRWADISTSANLFAGSPGLVRLT